MCVCRRNNLSLSLFILFFVITKLHFSRILHLYTVYTSLWSPYSSHVSSSVIPSRLPHCHLQNWCVLISEISCAALLYNFVCFSGVSCTSLQCVFVYVYVLRISLMCLYAAFGGVIQFCDVFCTYFVFCDILCSSLMCHEHDSSVPCTVFLPLTCFAQFSDVWCVLPSSLTCDVSWAVLCCGDNHDIIHWRVP